VLRPGTTRRLTCADVVVELRGFEPLTPCMPWPCGGFRPPHVTFRYTTFPQVDRPSLRGDT
jgi:hypothetical protein